MKLKIFISCSLIFLGYCLMAKEYPDKILFQKYAIQYTALDSIRNVLSQQEYPAAIEELKTLEKWAGEKGDKNLQHALRLMQYKITFERSKADEEFEKKLQDIIRDAGKNQMNYLQAEAQALLAEYFWGTKNYASALENYIYAYEVYNGFSKDEFPQKAEYLYQIGGRYYYFRDYQTAKKYFLEVWHHIPAEKIENQVSKLNTLALCYSNLDDYDSAAWYFHKAEEYAIKNKQELWQGIISGNLGNNYLKQNKIDEAIALFEKNIRLSRKHLLKDDLALSLSEYGAILLLKNEPQKSLVFEKEALAIVYEKELNNNNIFVSRIYPHVARAYAANGNTALAYIYLDSATRAKAIVEKEKNMVFVSGVQHKIDVEKHMAALQAKEAELKLQKYFRNSLLAGFTIMLLFTAVFFLQRNRIRSEKKISDYEKQRSEELLLNILPEEVAAELKATGGAEAKSFENVSVLFTDFVNFTQLSEKLSPQQLVQEIHYCFTAFDKIIERNGLEKIKTIGDAYLAVCGLPMKYNNHAQKTVQAAIEIRDFMLARQAGISNASSEIFNIRIGINSGPVVAGIVGVKKFAYDIWGDTVNTAARMEQHSEPGKINISGSTFELIKNDFQCEYRGKIEAKNKGRIDMYFVK